MKEETRKELISSLQKIRDAIEKYIEVLEEVLE